MGAAVCKAGIKVTQEQNGMSGFQLRSLFLIDVQKTVIIPYFHHVSSDNPILFSTLHFLFYQLRLLWIYQEPQPHLPKQSLHQLHFHQHLLGQMGL